MSLHLEGRSKESAGSSKECLSLTYGKDEIMTGRNDFDELLSAYLDGEVSSDERRQIAQRLAGNAEYRSELETLKALQSVLRELPRYRVAPEVHERVMRDIQRLAPQRGIVPTPAALDPELLSAYFDGEVSDGEREMVERALAEDAAYRDQFQELRQLDAALRQLPVYALGHGFAERVAQRIAVEAASAQPAEARRPQVAQRRATRNAANDSFGWRSLAWTALAVAAVLVVMVNFRPVPERRPVIVDSGVNRGVDGGVNRGVDPGRAPPGGMSPFTLVDRRLQDRLLLVYEVAVTPEGVRQGVFFRLLKRHGIHVLDTVPVPERDQRALLACRFLQGVQSVGVDAAGDMDRVQMYMVYCAARQAEGLFNELVGRPEGFASFSMNLTTRHTGEGVLPRLTAAFGERKLGEAIQLAANFGILSSAGRQVGAFGTVSYVDPDLLTPPPAPGESVLRQSEQDGAAPQADHGNPLQPADDFPCELLFVVRYLRPLPQDSQPRSVSMAK